MAFGDVNAIGADRTESGIGTTSRTITAFFDERDMAQAATDDLVAAGIPRQHVKITEGAGTEPVKATKDKSFWDELKDLFLPDEDRHSYAEGLSRGGYLLSVTVDEANYTRAVDILDSDGAVNIDERETGWRSEGWTGYRDASSTINAPVQSGTQAMPKTPGVEYSSPGSIAGADLAPIEAPYDAGRDATLQAYGARTPATRRDTDLGRARLRGYVADGPLGESRPSVGADYRAQILEHMDVIASDGTKIGTVDHLDGPDRIKLVKKTSPDGQHHFLPVTWIDHVDIHVHLNKSPAEVAADQD